jgi:hypothetical protein
VAEKSATHHNDRFFSSIFFPKNHKCHKTSSICESKPSGKRPSEQLTIPFYVPSNLSFLNISLCFQNRPRNDYTSLISCCSCTLWNTNFYMAKDFFQAENIQNLVTLKKTLWDHYDIGKQMLSKIVQPYLCIK